MEFEAWLEHVPALDEFPLLRKRDLLGLCGCGRPEDATDYVCKVLAALELPPLAARFGPDEHSAWLKQREAAIGLPREHAGHEFVLHQLDHLGLTEHGGGIGGSWLSETGKQLLAAYRKLGEDAEKLDHALNGVGHEILNPKDREQRLRDGTWT